MSVLNMVRTIKKIHKEDIVMIKIGNFYSVYGKDAYILSWIFSYKLRIDKEDMYTTGFPCSSLSRVLGKLQHLKINYVVVDRRDNYSVDDRMDNKELNTYSKHYEMAKEYIKYMKKLENIYLYIKDNVKEQEIQDMLIRWEKEINERRNI